MIEAPFRRIKNGFENTLIEDVYLNHNRRVGLFRVDKEVIGAVWHSSVEDYFNVNKAGTPIPEVVKNISGLANVQIYSFALDGLVSGVYNGKVDLWGKSGKELKVCLAEDLSKPQVGDMVRLFVTPLDNKLLSSGAFAFYLRNYSLENETSGLNSENPQFQEELTRTKYPGLDDTLIYHDKEDTIRNSTKRVIQMVRETKGKYPKRFKQPVFTFDHNTISKDVEDAAYEELINMAYIKNPPFDSRNYGMRMVSVKNVAPLRFLTQRGGSVEEIFIPEGENKFRVLGRTLKGKEEIQRVNRLLSTPRQIVPDNKLDKFFYMCKEAREGRTPSEEITRMLN
ncbi:MAG: hypothetical protein AABW50_03630 [Nanoarchaeota archaeon]